MLVLTRGRGERLYVEIPPGTTIRVIEVVLVEAERGKARIGFEAARDIKIVRSELLERGKD